MRLAQKLVEFQGRILPQEKILQGHDVKYDAGEQTDWTKELRSKYTFSRNCCGMGNAVIHRHRQLIFFSQKLVTQEMEYSETSVHCFCKVCGEQIINAGK
jgi:hypothetical protein